MKTLDLTPSLSGSSGYREPEPVQPRRVFRNSEAWRPALIGLAILLVGIGLILLKSAAWSEPTVEPLQLPLPMPAGTLMAEL